MRRDTGTQGLEVDKRRGHSGRERVVVVNSLVVDVLYTLTSDKTLDAARIQPPGAEAAIFKVWSSTVYV